MIAAAVSPGQWVRIGPHDVYRNDEHPYHLDTPRLTVMVDPDNPPEFPRDTTLVVISWVTWAGRPCGVCVYDRDDELVAVP
jgi:hypothetical protein